MLKRGTLKRGRRKEPTALERRHMERVAGLGCLVCGAGAERHHVRGYADRAGSISKDDRLVCPLCPTHHRFISPGGMRVSVHDLGHQGFMAEHGIDLFAEAERLWAETLEIEQRKDAA